MDLCLSQIRLDVVPDNMAVGLLRAVSRLLGLSILPAEPVLRFLSQCCLSLLALLVTLQQEAPADTDYKRLVLKNDLKHYHVIKTSEGEGLKRLGFRREAIWSSCVTSLSSVPRLLRMVLQSMRVRGLNEEELPQLGQILSMLLQHTPLHNQLLANTALLQEIIQNLTVNKHLPEGKKNNGKVFPLIVLWMFVFQRYARGATREQWLTDLLYCYSVTVAHGSSTHRGNLRDVY